MYNLKFMPARTIHPPDSIMPPSPLPSPHQLKVLTVRQHDEPRVVEHILRLNASNPRHGSTAISYECSSFTYFQALLDEMEDDDDDDDEDNEECINNSGSDIMRDIQSKLIERHVHSGLLTPKTIPAATASEDNGRYNGDAQELEGCRSTRSTPLPSVTTRDRIGGATASTDASTGTSSAPPSRVIFSFQSEKEERHEIDNRASQIDAKNSEGRRGQNNCTKRVQIATE